MQTGTSDPPEALPPVSSGLPRTREAVLKTDFKREIETYTAPREEFSIVEVPALQYFSIDGHGDRNPS